MSKAPRLSYCPPAKETKEKKPKKELSDAYEMLKEAKTIRTIVQTLLRCEKAAYNALNGSQAAQEYTMAKLNGEIGFLNSYAKFMEEHGVTYAAFKNSNHYKEAMDDMKALQKKE